MPAYLAAAPVYRLFLKKMNRMKKEISTNERIKEAALELSTLPIRINVFSFFPFDSFNILTSIKKGLPIDLIYNEESKLNLSYLRHTFRSFKLYSSDTFLALSTLTLQTYPSSKIVKLTKPKHKYVNFFEVIKKRRSIRKYTNRKISLSQLSTLLYYSIGITSVKNYKIRNMKIFEVLRSWPSGGGLYPLDVYLIPLNVENLSLGVYFYNIDHSLSLVKNIKDKNMIYSLFDKSVLEIVGIDKSSLLVFIVGNFWRSKLKYGIRAYRYVLQESGHIAQNFYLVSTALKLGACAIGGFIDDRVNKILGIDGVNESCIYSLVIG
jgi:SagB-type dehydrogenase family enzyme